MHIPVLRVGGIGSNPGDGGGLITSSVLLNVSTFCDIQYDFCNVQIKFKTWSPMIFHTPITLRSAGLKKAKNELIRTTQVLKLLK